MKKVFDSEVVSCGGTRTSLGNWYTRITKLLVNEN